MISVGLTKVLYDFILNVNIRLVLRDCEYEREFTISVILTGAVSLSQFNIYNPHIYAFSGNPVFSLALIQIQVLSSKQLSISVSHLHLSLEPGQTKW